MQVRKFTHSVLLLSNFITNNIEFLKNNELSFTLILTAI